MENTYPKIEGSSPEAHSPEPILKEWGRKEKSEKRQDRDGGWKWGAQGGSRRRSNEWGRREGAGFPVHAHIQGEKGRDTAPVRPGRLGGRPGSWSPDTALSLASWLCPCLSPGSWHPHGNESSRRAPPAIVASWACVGQQLLQSANRPPAQRAVSASSTNCSHLAQ